MKNKLMPCSACKLLRRRCTEDCIFLPYFPPTEPQKFIAVHRVFGASNITKMLQQGIPMDNRADAVISMVYEATARLEDPVYGSVGIISSLQEQVFHLHSQLNKVSAEVMALKSHLSHNALSLTTENLNDEQNAYFESFDASFPRPEAAYQCFQETQVPPITLPHLDMQFHTKTEVVYDTFTPL